MDVHYWAWIILAGIIISLIIVDIVGHVRTPHVPTIKESAWWSLIYVVLALAFGGVIWFIWGSTYAVEYIAGWATEKALSIDNLFVFVIILSTFRVPRQYQQKALLSGIVLALIFRFVFIMAGAAVIERFSWVFYIFGIWLLWTAFSQARQGIEKPEDETTGEFEEVFFLRLTRKMFRVSNGFVGDHFVAKQQGKTYITPLFLCVVALGSADLMFAFDSIPAIFGLTREPYIVFASNAFALLGLRQMYFLIDGLLSRLVYLHYGLAVILGFIGVKLILHALTENSLAFINGGHGFNVPDIGIGLSLGVIVGTIIVTVILSLLKSSNNKKKTDK